VGSFDERVARQYHGTLRRIHPNRGHGCSVHTAQQSTHLAIPWATDLLLGAEEIAVISQVDSGSSGFFGRKHLPGSAIVFFAVDLEERWVEIAGDRFGVIVDRPSDSQWRGVFVQR